MSGTLGNLADRGAKLASNPARIDFEIFMEAAQNLYNPEENPNGAFPLNIAENQLMTSEMKGQLSSIIRHNEIPDWTLKYTALLGNIEVRKVVAEFMERYLCKVPIMPDSIGLSAGASAIIEVSSFLIANPGDVVVIPAPSYPMYTNDMGIKSGMERYDLQTNDALQNFGSEAPVTTDSLDSTWNELNNQGKVFKILLVTSPDNPTGSRYTEKELRALAHWCIQHEVHMIVNEIYGLSLIDIRDQNLKADYPAGRSYVSFAKIMHEMDNDFLHLWYGFSKDFSMSGLRIGVVHSLNKNFMKGFENANVPHLVSNMTQWVLGELLKDTRFIDTYILENQKRLTGSYKLMVAHLRKNEIPYVPSEGSFFVWADFSKYLVEDSDYGQERLWLDIYHHAGVLLTPGGGFGHEKKGWFRIVFTAVPFAHLKVAMERITTYLSGRTN
ncbi:aminotransferase class I/II-fold pyridoxal phosphate-dependent enzyme [Maribacter sp. 2307UL18-2]|uniref:aminotransferase class I/II-fold pyridoxal phosphate-dependent enzyme n=1 Tax=Maribacter sp. 2307UL18-2 TaxID=3386274 RepID=UPI0039BD7B40